jgi:hypothetical protein
MEWLARTADDARDVESARGWYQRIIDVNHRTSSPVAAINLAHLLQREGDVKGARAAYQKALGSGHKKSEAEASRRLAKFPFTTTWNAPS